MFKTIFHEKNDMVIPHFINDGTWSLVYDISIKLTTYHSFGRVIQITPNRYDVENVVIENIHSYSDKLLCALNEYINDISSITFVDKSVAYFINSPLCDNTILNHLSYIVNEELQSRNITKHDTRKMRRDDYFKNQYVLSIITKELIKHIGLSFLTSNMMVYRYCIPYHYYEDICHQNFDEIISNNKNIINYHSLIQDTTEVLYMDMREDYKFSKTKISKEKQKYASANGGNKND